MEKCYPIDLPEHRHSIVEQPNFNVNLCADICAKSPDANGCENCTNIHMDQTIIVDNAVSIGEKPENKNVKIDYEPQSSNELPTKKQATITTIDNLPLNESSNEFPMKKQAIITTINNLPPTDIPNDQYSPSSVESPKDSREQNYRSQSRQSFVPQSEVSTEFNFPISLDIMSPYLYNPFMQSYPQELLQDNDMPTYQSKYNPYYNSLPNMQNALPKFNHFLEYNFPNPVLPSVKDIPSKPKTESPYSDLTYSSVLPNFQNVLPIPMHNSRTFSELPPPIFTKSQSYNSELCAADDSGICKTPPGSEIVPNQQTIRDMLPSLFLDTQFDTSEPISSNFMENTDEIKFYPDSSNDPNLNIDRKNQPPLDIIQSFSGPQTYPSITLNDDNLPFNTNSMVSCEINPEIPNMNSFLPIKSMPDLYAANFIPDLKFPQHALPVTQFSNEIDNKFSVSIPQAHSPNSEILSYVSYIPALDLILPNSFVPSNTDNEPSEVINERPNNNLRQVLPLSVSPNMSLPALFENPSMPLNGISLQDQTMPFNQIQPNYYPTIPISDAFNQPDSIIPFNLLDLNPNSNIVPNPFSYSPINAINPETQYKLFSDLQKDWSLETLNFLRLKLLELNDKFNILLQNCMNWSRHIRAEIDNIELQWTPSILRRFNNNKMNKIYQLNNKKNKIVK